MRVGLGLSAVCLAVLLSAGCGSSSSKSTAQLRLFLAENGMPNVNVVADGTTLATNLGYGSASNYLTVNSGSVHLQLVPVGGGSPVVDQMVSINASAHETLVLAGASGGSQALALTDGGTTASTGNGYVRVVNAAASMTAADIYIVPPGTQLTTATATNIGFGQDTNYELTPLGNYEVFFTSPGTTSALLATGPLNLGGGGTASINQTVIAYDAIGGGFNYIMLADQ